MFGYKHIQKDRAIAKEKSQYVAAETELNNIADQIVSKFGKPADRKELKACGYTSQEFGRGALYCNVDVNLLYGTSSLASSVQLAKSIEGNGLKGGSIKQEYDSTSSGNTASPVDIFVESFDAQGLDCFIDYSHHFSGEDFKLEGFADLNIGNANQALLIDMNCNARSPKAVYYPVTNVRE